MNNNNKLFGINKLTEPFTGRKIKIIEENKKEKQNYNELEK